MKNVYYPVYVFRCYPLKIIKQLPNFEIPHNTFHYIDKMANTAITI